MSATFDKEIFKNKLLAAGYDWSDQKIDNYLALKNASNNLKTEMISDTNPGLYDIIRKWESGDRSSQHNNFGAHIWTKELENKFGAKKGTTFTDSAGKTYHTAKYDTVEKGERAGKFVIDKIAGQAGGPEEFVSQYTGLASDSTAYQNYLSEVKNVFSPLPTAFGRSRDTTRGLISQEDKNYLWDFTGNLLWNAMDLTTFGALGAADPERLLGYEKDTLQKALTGVAPGESPETLAGRVGAGLGGVLGFMTPFGITKGLVGKGVGLLPKVGAGRAAKRIVKEGSTFLESAGKSQKGYKKFKQLGPEDKKQFFEPIVQTAFGTKALKSMAQDKFQQKWRTSVSKAIERSLKAKRITPIKGPAGNVEKLTDIVEKIAHINGKSVLRTSSLEELIGLGLGGAMGAKKLAQIIATSAESALLFAAVETPMEIFQSINEDREMDVGRRIKHAMILGGMLGPIHYIKGGKNWGNQRGITRAAFKHIKDSIVKKRPYKNYDVSKQGDRDQLRVLAHAYFNSGAKEVLNSRLPDGFKIYSRTMIDKLAKSKKGAKELQNALIGIDGAFQKYWKELFLKEAWQDLRDSSFRMFAGSMAFNYETVFHDDIPIEDKVFHIALGAFMTKRGRQLKYTDKSGYIQVTETGAYRSIGNDFVNASKYLDLLGMKPSEATFNAITNGHIAAENFFRANLNHPDMEKMHDILRKKKVIDANDGSDRAKPPKNKRGKVGQHPIYEQTKFLYDYNTNHKTKMVDVDRLTVAEIKSVETALKNARFDALSDGTRGIETLLDLDHVHFEASDKSWQSIVDLHINASEDIFNELSQGRGFAQREESPGFSPRIRLYKLKVDGNVSKANRKLANMYNKMVSVLDDIAQISVDKAQTLEVKNEHFKNINTVFEKHQNELNRLIHGEDISPSVFSPQLMQDGLIEQVLLRQGFYKSVRDVHKKLNNLDDANLWRERTDVANEHQGKQAKELMVELFEGDHFLYKELEFGREFTERQVDFANSLLKVLRSGPQARVSMIPGMEQPGKMESVSKLNALMNIFENNNIGGFSKNQKMQLDMFVDSYIRYDFQNFIKGARRGDGTPLNEVDMNIVSELTRAKWVGPNLQAVDVIGMMSLLNKIIKPTDNARQILDSISNHKDAHILMPALERISNNYTKSVEEIATRLVKDYNDLIEPYMKTEKGGILQHDGTIAQPEMHDLLEVVTKLESIRAGKERVKYTVLMEELEKARNNNLTDYASQQLEKLYEMYSHGGESATNVMMSLANNGLYNLKDNKLIGIDRDNPTLAQKLDKVLEEMNRDVIKDWPSTIENNLDKYRRGSESKKTEVEVDQNTSKQSFQSRYNLGEAYEFENKTYDQIKQDMTKYKSGRKVSYKDWDVAEKDVAMQEMIQVKLNTDNAKRITKLSAINGTGIVSDVQHTMNKNSLFKYLDEAGGVDKNTFVLGPKGEKIYDRFLGLKYYAADFDVIMKDNTTKNVIKDPGSKAEQTLQGLLDHSGEEVYFDASIRKDWLGEPMYEKAMDGSILVRLGDLDWGLAISKDPRYMRPFAKNYDAKIQEWKKKYGSEYKEVFNKLEKIYSEVFDKKEVTDKTELIEGNKLVKEFEYELRNKSAKNLTNPLQTLITHGMMDKNMGKNWWKHVLDTNGGHRADEVAKTAKRIRLMSNVSMKELSLDHIVNVRDVYKTNFAELKYDKIRKNLDKIIKRGHLMELAIAEDSGVEFTSVLTKARSQIETAQKASKTHKKSEFLLDEFDFDAEGRPTFMKGKDITDVDSYMAVSKEMMDVLYALVGRGNVDGLGGMKPIIHKYGDKVIIGKTAFVHDRKLNKFFKNNKVDAVLFESASKINYDASRSNVIKDWKSFKDLNNLKLEKNFTRELLQPEDISMGAVINADKKAHISHQKFINLDSGEESRAAFEWSIEKETMDFIDLSKSYFDVFDTNDATAYAKYLNESKSLFDDKSHYGRWLEENGPPMAGFGIRENFINSIKADKLDKGGVLKMQTRFGGQSVLSPGVVDKKGNPLKYSIFTRKKDGTLGHDQYQYGEANLPNVAGNKKVKLDRLSFIDRNPSGPDKIVKLDAIKGLNEAHKLRTGTNINNLTYIKDLQATLKEFNKAKKKEYQITVVFGRNPSIRDGDIPIVGLKEILHADYGNTAQINSWDLSMRLEGDYDIDKVDWWYDSPTKVLKKWDKISGSRIRVVPGGPQTKTSLPQMDWMKSETINHWANDVVYTKKLFGTVSKTRRTINALRNYDSGFQVVNENGVPVRGLQISRGDRKGGGIIYIDEANFKDSVRLLENDMVDIIDSMGGYPKEIYGPEADFKNSFLFGDKKANNPDAGGRYWGIFKLAKYDDSPPKDKKGKKIITSKKWVTTSEQIDLSKTEKAIIRSAMRPYESMLGLGSELYEGGKAKPVKYDDLMTGIKAFDAQMSNIGKNIYLNLKKYEGVKEGELNEYFQNKKGNWVDPLGDFGANIRPHFYGTPNFKNMLPFERTIAFLTKNNELELDPPGALYGTALKDFQNFYAKNMYTENYGDYAKEFISRLRKNNQFLNGLNMFDFEIKRLKTARADARQDRNEPLIEWFNERIRDTELNRTSLEKKMINVSGNTKDEWAKDLRKEARAVIRSNIIRNLRTPPEFPVFRKWDNETDARKWIDTKAKQGEDAKGSNLLDNYVKTPNMINFKGMHSVEHADLIFVDNYISAFENIWMQDTTRPSKDIMSDLLKDVSVTKKMRGKLWAKYNGDYVEPGLTINKASNIINDHIETIFKRWEARQSGAGRIYLFNLMKPVHEKFTFTYFNGNIMPAFQTGSTKLFKTVMNFIAGANDKLIPEFEKQRFYSTMAPAYRRHLRAVYGGGKAESHLIEFNILDNITNQRNDIFSGASPLVDDITGWSGGIQEMELNPQMKDAFGLNNRTVAYNLAHQALDPSIIKSLGNAAYMAYMPKAYIGGDVSPIRYPAVNGWTNWYKMHQSNVKVMLGNELDQSILFPKTPKVSTPYQDAQPVRDYESKARLHKDVDKKVGGC